MPFLSFLLCIKYLGHFQNTDNLMKDTFALDSRKSRRTATAKADVFLTGIVQLLGVLLADAMHKPYLYKSVRKLLSA